MDPMSHCCLVCPNNKALVLDLDETLFHTTPTPPRNTAGYRTVYVMGSIYFVTERPFMHFFLYSVRAMGFRIFIFTAGQRAYATAIIQALCIDDYLSRRNVLCREDCSVTPNKRLYKDLTKIPHPASQVVHVDNDPCCFYSHPENGILVPSFRQDLEKTDKVLLNALPVLNALRGVSDVRHILRAI